MNIYQIYDAEDNSVVLRKGTLNECRIALHQWLDDNNDEGWEQEKYEEYPNLESFLSSPIEFINQHGDTDVEIYSDWMLSIVYAISDSNILVNKIELASELASAKLEDMVEENIYSYNDIYVESEAEMTYTEVGQDIFHGYYDHYLTIIEQAQIK